MRAEGNAKNPLYGRRFCTFAMVSLNLRGRSEQAPRPQSAVEIFCLYLVCGGVGSSFMWLVCEVCMEVCVHVCALRGYNRTVISRVCGALRAIKPSIGTSPQAPAPPQILGRSLPEVIRSSCAHHHHKVFARPFGVERSLSRSQARAVGRPALGSGISGQRHPSRPASRRSIGRPRHLEPDR